MGSIVSSGLLPISGSRWSQLSLWLYLGTGFPLVLAIQSSSSLILPSGGKYFLKKRTLVVEPKNFLFIHCVYNIKCIVVMKFFLSLSQPGALDYL